MTVFQIFLSLLFAFSIGFGQILFKLTALSISASSGNFFVRVGLNPSAWLAFGWYGVSSFLWLFILMQVPLSRAYPFALLGSAIVPIFSMLIFHERLTFSYWLGGSLVILGLYISLGNVSNASSTKASPTSKSANASPLASPKTQQKDRSADGSRGGGG